MKFAVPAAGTSPIVGYQYTLDGGGTWADLDVNDTGNGLLTGSITGLTNDTEYHIRVRALSNDGHGPTSARVGGTPSAVIVKVAPSAVVVAHTFGNHSAVLSFSAPEPGTAPITRYEYTLDGGDHWVTLTTTGDGPIIGTISALTNGTAYTVEVRAVSDDGNGTASAPFTGTPQEPAPPQVAPGQVVVGEFGFGDGGVGLAFEAPDAGSSPITKYQYTLDDGDTWHDLSTIGTDPLLSQITGLTNGTSYSIKVRAVSDDGNGTASAAVAGTPEPESVLAGAPTMTTVDFGNQEAVLHFTAPIDTGSDPITGYEVSTDDGDTWDTLPTSGTSPFVVTLTGLTNGTSYDVQVRAVTDAGKGAASTAVTGTPHAPVVVVLPGAVTGLTATPGDGQVVLSFPEPDAGTSPTSGYQYTYDAGTNWYPLPTTGTDPLSSTIGGLGNGTSYTYQVRAVSADGHGEASNTATATPSAAASVPGAPVLNQDDSYWHYKDSDRAQLDLWIDSPFVNGGSTITGYQMSVNSGSWVDVTWDPASPHNATKLLAHDCDAVSAGYRIRAVNANGPSLPSNSITLHNFDRDAYC